MICRANEWTGFYMIGNFLMKELMDSPSCVNILINTEPKHVFPQILVKQLPNLNFQGVSAKNY